MGNEGGAADAESESTISAAAAAHNVYDSFSLTETAAVLPSDLSVSEGADVTSAPFLPTSLSSQDAVTSPTEEAHGDLFVGDDVTLQPNNPSSLVLDTSLWKTIPDSNTIFQLSTPDSSLENGTLIQLDSKIDNANGSFCIDLNSNHENLCNLTHDPYYDSAEQLFLQTLNSSGKYLLQNITAR